MVIACPSVPHTGHHFMLNRIFNMFDPLPANQLGYNDNTVVADHFHRDKMDRWVTIVKKYKCFIPLRHPARCKASYEKRPTIKSTIKDYRLQWQAMMSLIPYYSDPFFFHLDDLEIREKEADQILNYIGSDHKIDWSVNTESGSKHGTHDIALTDELLEGVPSEFIDFYEGTKL